VSVDPASVSLDPQNGESDTSHNAEAAKTTRKGKTTPISEGALSYSAGMRQSLYNPDTTKGTDNDSAPSGTFVSDEDNSNIDNNIKTSNSNGKSPPLQRVAGSSCQQFSPLTNTTNGFDLAESQSVHNQMAAPTQNNNINGVVDNEKSPNRSANITPDFDFTKFTPVSDSSPNFDFGNPYPVV